MFKTLVRVVSLLLFASTALFVTNVAAAQPSPNVYSDTGNPGVSSTEQGITKASMELWAGKFSSELRNFIASVNTGQANIVTGLFVNEQLALDVIQQPSNNPGYISPTENTVTEFGMARDYGTIGMLAHNYLAGAAFHTLETGTVIYLVYGDGSVQPYTIANLLSYQALQPNSPYSNFLSLDNPDEYLTAADLFYSVYGQEDALVLQTCIENQGIDSWGRLFIIAIPGAFPTSSNPL